MPVLGLDRLKLEFRMTSEEVECPVADCTTVVRRRRRGEQQTDDDFRCAKCGIYVFPSTFAYVAETDNLLWNENVDAALLQSIKAFKAEIDRLGHERSEDAVSWNVFRCFDRINALDDLATLFSGQEANSDTQIVWWSYSERAKQAWEPLLKARVEFGEARTVADATGKGVSEPDIILFNDDLLLFVEAKFGSGNVTPSRLGEAEARINNPKAYVSGGDNWFNEVFEADFATVLRDRKYELLRFWLFGSWIAQTTNRRFVFVNLVRDSVESTIEADFGRHIRQTDGRRFVRHTWESIDRLLEGSNHPDAARLRAYLEHKTIGFAEDANREIARPIKAFATQPSVT